jgi:hypothetical protein
MTSQRGSGRLVRDQRGVGKLVIVVWQGVKSLCTGVRPD